MAEGFAVAESDSGNAGTIPRIVFSSDELPAELDNQARFALWQNLHEEHFGSTDLYFLNEREFSVRVEFAQFGAVGLGHLEGTMRRIARTPRHVAADPSDVLMLALNRGKSAIACLQRGRDVTLTPGMATLVTNFEASEVLAKGDNSVFTVNMPRDRLLDLVANVEDLVVRPLDPGSSAVRLLRRYLGIVLEPDGVGDDPALIEHVETTLLDLVALSLGAGREATEIAQMRGLRAARAQEIVAEIKSGFSNPAFSPRDIGLKLRLTPRYVQELLSETGTSFTERVLELRLQKARRMLANSRYDGLKITEIAYACGFNDISYFNRAFRHRFGMTPSDARGNARREDKS
jgi:AraC-like DNA-binding protein